MNVNILCVGRGKRYMSNQHRHTRLDLEFLNLDLISLSLNI